MKEPLPPPWKRMGGAFHFSEKVIISIWGGIGMIRDMAIGCPLMLMIFLLEKVDGMRMTESKVI